jgi:hypothetical protein
MIEPSRRKVWPGFDWAIRANIRVEKFAQRVEGPHLGENQKALSAEQSFGGV